MTKTFVIAAAALAALATPAAAANVPQAKVDVSDLDLSQPADQKKLDRRIDNAARRACRMTGFDAETRRIERECRLAMIENAAPQIQLAIAKARTDRFATIDLDAQG